MKTSVNDLNQSSTAVRPEDILPDGTDFVVSNNTVVRKGSIAAFLANIEIFEDDLTSDFQKQEALQAIKGLADAVIAVGLHKQVTFKNPEIEKILVERECAGK